MPRTYTARCPCGHEASASDEGLEFQNEDGSLIVLGHPGETRALEKLGYTWQRSEDEARLVRAEAHLGRKRGRSCVPVSHRAGPDIIGHPARAKVAWSRRTPDLMLGEMT